MPAHFSKALFAFLRDLKRHNDRAWFAANKERYERDVRDPMLRFIADAAGPLQRISREILADPRPVGGAMFRIYRDTRFSKDKTPYKTHAAAHFRHRAGGHVHTPGFYLHLEPGEVMAGTGIWRPDGPTLQIIRTALVDNDTLWKRITSARSFRRAGELEGEVARRPPRGFDPDHPLIADIRRRDFTVMASFTDADALSAGFLDRFIRFCEATAPLNEFLARALGLGW
jgi:uncharacterized protein (TIGR02453 family)